MITTQSYNQAIGNKYPWIAAEQYTSRIQIRRVDENLLCRIPGEEIGTDASGYYSKSTITFHDSNGKPLGEVAAKSYNWANNSSEDGETVGDALCRQSDPLLVAFITDHDYDSGSNVNHSEGHRQLTIYKMAEFDITAWIEARKIEAENAVIMAEEAATAK